MGLESELAKKNEEIIRSCYICAFYDHKLPKKISRDCSSCDGHDYNGCDCYFPSYKVHVQKLPEKVEQVNRISSRGTTNVIQGDYDSL